MRKILRRFLSGYLVFAIIFQALPVFANAPLAVVISEVNWAGSVTSSNDEWIELYNNSSEDINLSGWKIVDDGSSEYLIETGVIKAQDYFLIASSVNAAGVTADFVKSISLSNTGDSLILKNATGDVIDEVNPSGGAWPAGDNTNKLTMERIDLMKSGDDNWHNSLSSGGTPKVKISNTASPLTIFFESNKAEFLKGDDVQIVAKVKDAENLFAYGLDIIYNSDILEFIGGSEGALFINSGYETSFEYGFENNQDGHIVIAGSLLSDSTGDPKGLTGNGEIFTLNFKVIGNQNNNLEILSNAFAANFQQYIPLSFENISLKVIDDGQTSAAEFKVVNLIGNTAQSRYSLALSWQSPVDGADSYQVYRLNQKGEFVLIGETPSISFVDDDSIVNAGNVVAGVEYGYQVVPIKNGQLGEKSEVTVLENRGLKGDTDRSDRIDGKDLYQVASHFGAELGEDEEYAILLDSNYDGLIDGEELLDISANWALSYQGS